MIVANFEMGDNEVYTQSITQWDYGRVLRIQGLDLPSVVELHFSINCDDECTVTAIGLKNGEFTEVDIPDKLLQQKNDLIVYLYVANLEKGKTLKTIRIPIKERPKPMIPHSPEDEQLFREVLEQCESVQQAVLQTSEDVKKTNADVIKVAEDRKKVEAIAGVVTSVEEQIEELEQISQQLKNDAEQINSTVQEVKTASANAIAAKDKAQELANSVSTDKDSVDSIKQEVISIKQSIVDISEQVTPTINKGLQDIISTKDTALSSIGSLKTDAENEITDQKNSAIVDIRLESSPEKIKETVDNYLKTALQTATLDEVKSYLNI